MPIISCSALKGAVFKGSQQDFFLLVCGFILLHSLPISSILQYRSQMLSKVLAEESDPGLALLSFLLSLTG